MAQILNKNIRLSSSVKDRLDEARGSQSASSYIGLMLDFFDKTGENPRHINHSPTEKIEKRIEDLVRIFKAYERDTAKPMFDKIMDGRGTSDNREQLIRLASENQKLMKQLQDEQADKAQRASAEMAQKKLSDLAQLVISQCDPHHFNTTTLGSDLKVPRSFFEQLIRKIKEEYVL